MAKKFKVYISNCAQNDIEHIFFNISADSINYAKKFILELEKKIHTLDNIPERFAYIPEYLYFGTEYRHITYKKYRVIYKIEDSSVYILRVIHSSKLLDL